MKAIGIVGFKKSGKTTLVTAIARELSNKHYQVAVIKHSNEPLNHGKTDTGKFMLEVPEVALITPTHTEIIWKGSRDLKQVLPLLSADFLIVEGFKSLKYFPKVLCLRDDSEKDLLADGLELFTCGMDASWKERKVIDYLIGEEKDIKEMAMIIEQKSFLLPDANCGKCGYENCYNLAQAILEGKESIQKCSYNQEHISVKVNGKKVELNQFMEKLYQSILVGMLAPLKDIDSLDGAEIEIKSKLTDSDKERGRKSKG
jgi:molybdopterin-guanine dinucleotide biosynthesis protein B